MLAKLVDKIWENKLTDGGFAGKNAGNYRPDATAWAIIALSLAGIHPRHLRPARQRLALSQMKDGSIPISTDDPDVIWPTPLAILAWHGADEFRTENANAARFLVKTTGAHYKKKDPLGHDPELKGWPWVLKTHSWVEPTALAIIALRISGFGEDGRVKEGIRMLLDRQLAAGGWNYGNISIFGKDLYPMPETTGIALSALAGIIPGDKIRNSLTYLTKNFESYVTPLSLSFSLLGISSYGMRPGLAENLISRCLGREKDFLSYDTVMISLLAIALTAREGIIEAFAKTGEGK